MTEILLNHRESIELSQVTTTKSTTSQAEAGPSTLSNENTLTSKVDDITANPSSPLVTTGTQPLLASGHVSMSVIDPSLRPDFDTNADKSTNVDTANNADNPINVHATTNADKSDNVDATTGKKHSRPPTKLDAIPFDPSNPFGDRTTVADFIWQTLCGNPAMSPTQVIEVLVEHDVLTCTMSPYLPGLHPVTGHLCPGCHLNLDDINADAGIWFQGPIQDARDKAKHVLDCVSNKVCQHQSEALLAKYPMTIDSDPMRDGSTGSSIVGGHHVYNVAKSIKKRESTEALLCQVCDHSPTMPNFDMAQAHLLSHGIWLPPINDDNVDREIGPDEWNLNVAGFEPYYAMSIHQILVDPQEIEAYATEYFASRIASAVTSTDSYTARLDIVLPDNMVDTYGAKDPQASDGSDTKYMTDAAMTTPGTVPGLCFTCVHDTAKPMRQRMNTYLTQVDLMFHQATCLLATAQSILGKARQDLIGSGNSSSHDYYVGNALACPDPVCRTGSVQHSSLLDLLHHLCLVHCVDITRPKAKPKEHKDPKRASGTYMLRTRSFVDAKAVEDWLAGKDTPKKPGLRLASERRQALVKKKKAQGDNVDTAKGKSKNKNKAKAKVKVTRNKKGKGKGKGKHKAAEGLIESSEDEDHEDSMSESSSSAKPTEIETETETESEALISKASRRSFPLKQS